MPTLLSHLSVSKQAVAGVTGVAGIVALIALGSASGQVDWSDAHAATPLPVVHPLHPVVPAAVPAPETELAATPDLAAHGVVRSRDQAVLASRLTALITALPFDAGQSFRQGQLLVRFDCSQMRAQLTAADAAASAYRTTYETNVELDRYKAIGRNDVLVSQANLGKAAAEADALRAATDQCQIIAPFTGTVVDRTAHNHDIAASGQPLMTIQRLGNLEVELIVPSNWLTWIKPGSPFQFALEETGKTITGHVTRLGASIDPVSKTMRVVGAIDVTGTVLPGMSGVARFDERKLAQQDGADGRRS